MKTVTKCLPLTQEDVFVLRGKPMAKKLNPLQGSIPRYEEEWIYYKNTKEERFIFKNEKLIRYKTE
jgi:hypothetical protein